MKEVSINYYGYSYLLCHTNDKMHLKMIISVYRTVGNFES